MLFRKHTFLFFIFLVSGFGFAGAISGGKAIHVGLEVAKAPSHYFASKVFDKQYAAFITQRLEQVSHELLPLLESGREVLSEKHHTTLEKYVDETFTFFSFDMGEEKWKKVALPLIAKLGGGGLILGVQQCVRPESYHIENCMRLTGNLLCGLYGVKSEGWGWISRNALRLGLLWLPVVAAGVARGLGFERLPRGCITKNYLEWFSLLVNSLFDIKDYENYCKKLLLKHVLKHREELADILSRYASGDETDVDVVHIELREFVRDMFKNVSVIRRAIGMDCFLPNVFNATVDALAVVSPYRLRRARGLVMVDLEGGEDEGTECYYLRRLRVLLAYLQGARLPEQQVEGAGGGGMGGEPGGRTWEDEDYDRDEDGSILV